MKIRLFWKIFLGFWLTFFLMFHAIWAVLQFTNPHPSAFEANIISRIVSERVRLASMVIHYGGEQGLTSLVQGKDTKEYGVWSIKKLPAGASALPASQHYQGLLFFRQFDQPGPDGQLYRLNYQYNATTLFPPPPLTAFFHLPTSILLVNILCGFAFSAILAWYLTTPVRILRYGFERLSLGELNIRLRAKVGSRRDEIADLAQDFDNMAERLQQSVRAREQLLHDVSHELRSPLARLQVAIGLTHQNPQKMASMLERVQREANRLNTIVGELLTLSRLESGIACDDYFDLQELLDNIVSDARFEAPQLDIVLNVSRKDRAALPLFQGNVELIRRALENVIRNALRYSPPNGKVEVQSIFNYEQNSWSVVVSDAGVGVKPESLPHIFEPFVRAPGQATGGGFGLGLAITQRAVKAHEGRVSARNREPSGLEVTITLPQKQAD